jgi:DNA-binding NtrC family response regulator
VVNVAIPPLRERREDIPALVEVFLDRYGRETHRRVQIGPEVLTAFLAHDWPGNVRELENMVERLVVLAEGPEIVVDDLPERLRPSRAVAVQGRHDGGSSMGLVERVELFERTQIMEALRASGGNQTRAADALGIRRTSLQYKMKKYGLDSAERPQPDVAS